MVILASDPGVSDAAVGFHAQQAVEKWLKALLCHLRVNYAKTHDLVVLLDALADAGHPVPPHVDACKAFQPYAVRFRYDDIPVGAPGSLDRAAIRREVSALGEWVAQMIASGTGHP